MQLRYGEASDELLLSDIDEGDQFKDHLIPKLQMKLVFFRPLGRGTYATVSPVDGINEVCEDPGFDVPWVEVSKLTSQSKVTVRWMMPNPGRNCSRAENDAWTTAIDAAREESKNDDTVLFCRMSYNGRVNGREEHADYMPRVLWLSLFIDKYTSGNTQRNESFEGG